MLRGQQKLFNNLLFEQPKPINLIRGRSDDLIAKRDERLLHRHYYHAKILGKQYPKVLQSLSLEFDLSEHRIIVVLNENHPQLKELYKAQPSIKELKQKYAWLDWSN